MEKDYNKIMKIVAVLLGAAAIISVSFLIFAISQKSQADGLRKENELLKKENLELKNLLEKYQSGGLLGSKDNEHISTANVKLLIEE